MKKKNARYSPPRLRFSCTDSGASATKALQLHIEGLCVRSIKFSNESRFCRRRSNRRVKVWRSCGKCLADCSTASATYWWRPSEGVGQHLHRCWSISREIPLRSRGWTLPSEMTALSSTEWVCQKRRGYKYLLACMTTSFPHHNF